MMSEDSFDVMGYRKKDKDIKCKVKNNSLFDLAVHYLEFCVSEPNPSKRIYTEHIGGNHTVRDNKRYALWL